MQVYLRFRRATPLDLHTLQTWLLERALEHDKPTLLLQLACERLHREKIIRPGVTRLERLVATAREQDHDETYRRLAPLLSDERRAFLDSLLEPDATTGQTPLSWLRQEAVSHAASQILGALHKITFLRGAGVHRWDLSGLNPNRATWLARIGWKSTNQALQRMPPRRRYAVLVAFLHQALLHHTNLMITNKGYVRRKRGEDLDNQASCLNLVTNAVILWNTVYMAEVVGQLKREGYPVHDSDLARVWPTRYENLNVYGRFHFAFFMISRILGADLSRVRRQRSRSRICSALG